MKTIFRFTKLGLLLAAILSVGAVAGLAQNPCEDADGQMKASEEFDTLYANKTDPDVRQKAIDSGKAFVEKFGACEATKAKVDWLKTNLPKMETALAERRAAAAKAALLKKFDDALKAKNWDDAYVSGEEILAKYPDEFRTAEIVLAAIAGEEAFKGNNKYADRGLKYIKQSMADLEANKPFKVGDATRYGVSLKDVYNFEFPNRDDAMGWMNLYIGYITAVGQKNRAAALPYLYKASQITGASTSKSPVPFEMIGLYYFDELNKVVEKIKAAEASQSESDTPEVAQKKVDDIKALVAIANGTAERAMDAFARAFTLGKDAAYKARMKKNVEDAYNVRFGKKDGMDQWIAAAVAKPFVNPTTPIQPISDPEPAKTDGGTGTGVGAANGTGVGAANGTGVGAAKGNGIGNPSGSAVAPKPATPPVKKPGNRK